MRVGQQDPLKLCTNEMAEKEFTSKTFINNTLTGKWILFVNYPRKTTCTFNDRRQLCFQCNFTLSHERIAKCKLNLDVFFNV